MLVTLHGFSSMIVIHDSSMICHAENIVQNRQNFLCVSVLIKWSFICCLLSFLAINGISGLPSLVETAEIFYMLQACIQGSFFIKPRKFS